VAGSVVSERIETDGRVFVAGCEAKERKITLSGVEVGIASVRRWINRPNCRRECEAGKRELCERGISNIRYSFHGFISFHLSSPDFG
jgi:hypothetical protein